VVDTSIGSRRTGYRPDGAARARRRTIKTERPTKASPSEGASCVRTLITRAHSSLLSSLDAELDAFGVTGAQFEVLTSLSRSHNETAANLSRVLHYDTGSMTRMLDRLQEKGLVSRRRDTSDRRLVFLRLTGSGVSLIPRIGPAVRRALRRHLDGFSAEEIESLKRCLNRVIQNGQLTG